MDLGLTSGIVLLIAAAPVALGLAWYAWRNRSLPGSMPFFFLVPLAALWSLAGAAELLTTGLQAKLVWVNLEYLAKCFIPLAWLAVSLDYAGYRAWLRPWRLASLSIVPVVTTVLLWTNGAHQLMWTGVRLDSGGPFDTVAFTWGPWFWVHMLYSYALLFAAIGITFSVCYTAPPLYRRQPLALLAGSAIPIAVHTAFIFNEPLGITWDYTPIGFTIGGIVIAWGLFRVRLFSLVPVARHALVEDMTDGVLVLDGTDTAIDLNKSAQGLIGKPKKRILGRPLVESWPAWSQVAAPYSSGASHAQLRVGDNGEARHYEVKWSPLNRREEVIGRLVVLRDVTKRVLMEESLRKQALTDALTGLPNRALFMTRLDDAIHQAKRHTNALFAVMVLDIDRFKLINDSIGHQAGDFLLQSVAEKLKRCVREVDTVARMGGDEFMILLHDITSARDLLPILDRIREDLRAPVYFRQQEMTAASSVGVVIWNPSYEDPEDMLRAADTAMYQAKEAGRGCHRIFDEEMHKAVLRTLKAETDLRTSLRQGDFSLAYQPVVELKTGLVRSLEALIRWHHPERGTLLPHEFISVAESSGLIVSLGEMALEEVCSQISRWQSPKSLSSALPVSLNISARQLTEPDFVSGVLDRLAEWCVPHNRLIIEVTEAVLILDPQESKLAMQQLRDTGIRLSLDDFGTGWSSLQHLSTFPVHELKIDGSFVSRMVHGNTDFEVVHALTSLAHTLGLTVTGEGVERSEQWRLLDEVGCDCVQGYYVGEPMDPGELIEFLEDMSRGSCRVPRVVHPPPAETTEDQTATRGQKTGARTHGVAVRYPSTRLVADEP